MEVAWTTARISSQTRAVDEVISDGTNMERGDWKRG